MKNAMRWESVLNALLAVGLISHASLSIWQATTQTNYFFVRFFCGCFVKNKVNDRAN